MGGYHDKDSSQESRLGEKSIIPLANPSVSYAIRENKGGLLFENRGRQSVPCNLLIFSLARLHLQTCVVHFVYVARRLHVREDVILQLRHRLQRVRYVLVLLDVADHLGSLRTLGEVDKVGLLDQRGDTILDERQIREVHTCTVSGYSQTPGVLLIYRRKECTVGSPCAVSLGSL